MSKARFRIAHILHKADLTGGPGYSLLSFIDRIGSDYTNFILSNTKGELTDKLKEIDCQVCIFKLAVINKFNPIPYIVSLIRSILFYKKNKIDLAHFQFHSYRDPALLAAKISGIKSIIHIRGPASDFNKSWLSLADGYIFNSNFTKKIAGLGNEKEKQYHVIHNAVDLKLFEDINFLREEYLKKINIDSSKKIISYISRVHPVKNIEDFIKLADSFKDDSDKYFIVVGNIQDKNYYQVLKNLISDYKIKNIKFIGHVSNIAKILQVSDVLVHVALNEPFGRSIIEAYATKVPVVAYNSGAMPEIIKNNKTGFLVDCSDIQALSVAVDNLLNNEKLCNEITSNAYDLVKKEFNADKHAKEIESVYQQYLK